MLNHLDRAREGIKLLKEGRPLTEMTTSVEGMTPEALRQKRESYLEFLNTKSESELRDMLPVIEKYIEEALVREVKGTSERYWQRITILEKLGE